MLIVFLFPHPQAELAPGTLRLAWMRRACKEELPAKTKLETEYRTQIQNTDTEYRYRISLLFTVIEKAEKKVNCP